MESKSLHVGFCGEAYTVEVENRFSFGRSGDLEIDSNPFLHRHLGVLRYSGGSWWLDNVGSAILVEVVDTATPSRMRVAPGSSVSLGFADCVVRFQAGELSYEIDLAVPVPEADEYSFELSEGTQTVTAKRLGINLTDDQLRCIIALSKNRLLNPTAPLTIPTNKEAAATLDWKITRFNRKLDNVCDRLAGAGVGGLRGDTSKLARDRRQRLVEYAVTTGLVDQDSLRLIA